MFYADLLFLGKRRRETTAEDKDNQYMDEHFFHEGEVGYSTARITFL
jgi:hypothetical protein